MDGAAQVRLGFGVVARAHEEQTERGLRERPIGFQFDSAAQGFFRLHRLLERDVRDRLLIFRFGKFGAHLDRRRVKFNRACEVAFGVCVLGAVENFHGVVFAVRRVVRLLRVQGDATGEHEERPADEAARVEA